MLKIITFVLLNTLLPAWHAHFKTKAHLCIVSNVQMVKCLLLQNEWLRYHYLALLWQVSTTSFMPINI